MAKTILAHCPRCLMERAVFTHAISEPAMQTIVEDVIQSCGLGRWPVRNAREEADMTQQLAKFAKTLQPVDLQEWCFEQLLAMVEAKLTVSN